MADKTDKKKGFNKKILTILIEKARGERTTRKFAQDCGISYAQLHKLELGLQDNLSHAFCPLTRHGRAGIQAQGTVIIGKRRAVFAAFLAIPGLRQSAREVMSTKSIAIQRIPVLGIFLVAFVLLSLLQKQ